MPAFALLTQFALRPVHRAPRPGEERRDGEIGARGGERIASGRVALVVAVPCRCRLMRSSTEEVCWRDDRGQSRPPDAVPGKDGSLPVGEVILGHPGHADGIWRNGVGGTTQHPALEALHNNQESESRERTDQREDQHPLAVHASATAFDSCGPRVPGGRARSRRPDGGNDHAHQFAGRRRQANCVPGRIEKPFGDVGGRWVHIHPYARHGDQETQDTRLRAHGALI